MSPEFSDCQLGYLYILGNSVYVIHDTLVESNRVNMAVRFPEARNRSCEILFEIDLEDICLCNLSNPL